MTPEPSILMRRRIAEHFSVGLAWLATAIGLAVLALILFELLRRGISSLRLRIFLEFDAATRRPGRSA